jgi:ribosomal protein L40E
MTEESITAPTADVWSTAVGAGQPPADLPKPAQSHCSACGARLPSSARFCSACGTAQAPPVEDEAAATPSQFGGSSADLAELLSARGHVVSCPHCDELNNASAAWCRHCGQQLTTAGASHPATMAENVPQTSETYDDRQGRLSPAARRVTRTARRYGPEIALMALLGATAVALSLGRSPTGPASEAAHSAASRNIPTAQPAESVVSTAPIEPAAPLPVAPSGASGEEQEKASSSVSPPGAAQEQAQAPERRHKKVAKTAGLRTSAPSAIDELYRQRTAERCDEGLYGLLCRQRLRFELCKGKWTQDAHSGMEICRLNP